MKPILSTTDLTPPDGFTVVDARGHRCPVPTLILRRHMEAAPAGQGVILYANDPMAQIDVPHFCNQNNFVLVASEAKDEMWIFTVARATG
ncbi:sulfurtransferase TusA family protein [Asticcacaulis sp. 201]|uniref:sulfurtransferase TusA family protein n=1 Tax=Asticcacaulis sp. 201 TaxID=3028787 RepID=UPI002916F56E|nr:sulfurtransferase TusA family protein [Asticcacaulis sp. 201]MDV6329386.1 sulfurtransferase TusA family protein [Asticcacaulis sp. 201]